MTSDKPRQATPHVLELVLATDARHSYLQRMNSLVGPGAYSIPSTFHRPVPNMLLRAVQRENYGRDFARQKRISTATREGAADSAPSSSRQACAVYTHHARRDELRRLLLHLGLDCTAQDRWRRSDAGASPTPTERSARNVLQSRPASPNMKNPGDQTPRSPNSRSTSPSRRRWASSDIADIVADFGAQPPAEEPSDDDVGIPQQICVFARPPSYQHYLMSTSYLGRLKLLQRQRQRATSL